MSISASSGTRSFDGTEDDYSDDTATTGRLAIGSSVVGVANSLSDEDWFRVSFVAGERYRIWLVGEATGSVGTVSDPYFSGIYTASGAFVAETTNDDISSSNYNSEVYFTAPSSGSYYLSAGAVTSLAGGYRLAVARVADDFAATTGTVGQATVNGSVSGKIETAGDIDWFKVTLSAGHTYRIQLRGVDNSGGTLQDPYLTGLYSSAGSLIAGTSCDDSGGTRDPLLTYTATTSGVYYVAASAYGSATGTYGVRVTEQNLAPTLAARLSDRAVSEGQAFIFALAEDTFRDPEGAALTWQARQANGSALPSWLQFDSGTRTFSGTAPLNSSDVTVRVSVSDGVSSTYDDFVLTTATPDDYSATVATTGRLAVGQSVTGRVGAAEDIDWFRVSLTAGVTYVINLQGAGSGKGTLSDTYLYGVYSSSATYLTGTSNDDISYSNRESRVSFRATTSGTYFIAAGAYSTAVGTYTLSLAQNGNQAPIVANEIPDQTAPEGRAFSYTLPWQTFRDPEGQSLTLSARLADGSALPSWLRFDAAAQALSGTPPAGTGDLSIAVTATDPQGGRVTDTFVLRTPTVGDDYTATTQTTGTVRLDSSGVGSSSGQVEVANDIDWFKISLAAGMRYTVSVAGSPSGKGTLSDPYLYGIYNSSGTLISGTTNDDSGDSRESQVTYTATSSGVYYLAAGAYGDLTGSYRVLVSRSSSNPAPIVRTALADRTVKEGEAFSIALPTASFSDPGGEALTYRLSATSGGALPSWLSFNASTCTVSGTAPTGSADIGLTVTASDPIGQSVSSSFVLNTASASASTTPAAGSWTIMVYLDADNDLESFGIKDINEMEAVDLPNGVRIVVQVDRSSDYDTSNGNWSDTRRGVISRDSSTSTIGSSLSSIGEKNMGDQTTLTDFINWSTSNYAADNYALVMWDHGGGLDGACWDETNNSDNLTNAEITRAISSSNVGHLDFVGFDACLMAMTEQAGSLTSVADVMVASQRLEPGDGWDYTQWMSNLASDTNITTTDLARADVRSYGSFYGNGETLSAIDLSKVGALNTALSTFVQATASASSSDWSKIRAARDAATFYQESTNRDLGGFMSGVASRVTTTSIRSAAQAVSTALTAAVVEKTAMSGNSGLSIYLPSSSGQMAGYTANNYSFLNTVSWDSFCSRLVSA